MSETFEAHRMRCFERPDDTDLIRYLEDEISNARDSGDSADLEWAEERASDFFSSRDRLEYCWACGDRALEGKDVIVIFNIKDVAYECVLHWKCFWDSPGWQAALL